MAGFDESKHPRDKNGEFTSKGSGGNLSFEDVKSDYETLKENGISDKGLTPEAVHKRAEEIRSAKSKIPTAHDFKRIKTSHHLRHIRDLGYKNEREYINAAVDFFNSENGELFYSIKRERYYRYDEKNGLFVVVDHTGLVNTFLCIPKKEFIKIRRQDKLI